VWRDLEFWFEFASAYSYVAAMRIETLARDAGVRLVWKPSILGPIFALQGWNDSQPGRYAVRREVDEKISAS
jgi:2-hydroxychromene-2-carboxylate isomerase